jgi:hypothetical protein
MTYAGPSLKIRAADENSYEKICGAPNIIRYTGRGTVSLRFPAPSSKKVAPALETGLKISLPSLGGNMAAQGSTGRALAGRGKFLVILCP